MNIIDEVRTAVTDWGRYADLAGVSKSLAQQREARLMGAHLDRTRRMLRVSF
jgi:hypothetical protein